MVFYFFCCLAAAETFHCATLMVVKSENHFVTSYLAAAVTALILGKSVFVLDKFRLTRVFDHKPLAIVVLYKTVIFTVFTNLILALDHFIRHHSAAPENATDPFKYFVCFAAHQLILVIAFGLFFAARELDAVLGKGTIASHFFGHRRTGHAASAVAHPAENPAFSQAEPINLAVAAAVANTTVNKDAAALTAASEQKN